VIDMQFLGSIEAKIYAKMRVFIPASFRKILQVSADSFGAEDGYFSKLLGSISHMCMGDRVE